MRATPPGREGLGARGERDSLASGAGRGSELSRLLTGRRGRDHSPCEAHRARLPQVVLLRRAAGMDWGGARVAGLLRRGGLGSVPLLMAMAGRNDPDADGTVVAEPLVDATGEAPSRSPEPGGLAPQALDAAARAVVGAEAAPHYRTDPLVRMTGGFDALRGLRGAPLRHAAADWAEQFVPQAALLDRDLIPHDCDLLTRFFESRSTQWSAEREPLTATLSAALLRTDAMAFEDGGTGSEQLLWSLLPDYVPLIGISARLQMLHTAIVDRYGHDTGMLARLRTRAEREYSDRLDAVFELSDLLDQQHTLVQLTAYPTAMVMARAMERVAHRRVVRGLPRLMASFVLATDDDQRGALRRELGQVLDHIERFALVDTVEDLAQYRAHPNATWRQHRQMDRLVARFTREHSTEGARRVLLGRYRDATVAGRSREAAQILRLFHASQAQSQVRAALHTAVEQPTAAAVPDVSTAAEPPITAPQLRDELQALLAARWPGTTVELVNVRPYRVVMPVATGMLAVPVEGYSDNSYRQSLIVQLPSTSEAARELPTLLRMMRDHIYVHHPLRRPVAAQWETLDIHVPSGQIHTMDGAAVTTAVNESGLGHVRLYQREADGIPTLIQTLADYQLPMATITLAIPTTATEAGTRIQLGEALLRELSAVARARDIHTDDILTVPLIPRAQIDLQVPDHGATTQVEAVAEFLNPLTESVQLGQHWSEHAITLGAVVAGAATFVIGGEAENIVALLIGTGLAMFGALRTVTTDRYAGNTRYAFPREIEITVNGTRVLTIHTNSFSRAGTTVDFNPAHPLTAALRPQLRWRSRPHEASAEPK